MSVFTLKFPLVSKVNFFLPSCRPRRAYFHLGAIGTAAPKWTKASAKKREVLVSVIEEKTQCLKRTADFMSSPRSARSKRIRMAKFVQGFNVQDFKCSLGLVRKRFELISSIIPLQMAMYEAKRA